MKNEKKYKYIFGVVTYRNIFDLEELLDSLSAHMEDYRVIVVNNYYDDESERLVFDLSMQYNCDFIHSENKGYGVGNNIALRYALENYDFDFFIVSNPDITIRNFSPDILNDAPKGVIAPAIYTITRKNQNPMRVRDCKFSNLMIYRGLKNNSNLYFNIGRATNKLFSMVQRIQSMWSRKKYWKIYQAHGAFVIFSREIFDIIDSLYDEKMFLFAEESALACKLRDAGVDTYYCADIQVDHKEDGSMKYRNDISVQLRESNLYVFQKYYGLEE